MNKAPGHVFDRVRTLVAMRRETAPAVIVCALILAVGWSWMTLSSNRQAAVDAASDLSACRAAAARIEQLRRRPAVAESSEVKPAELSRRMDQSARAANLPDGSLREIEPQPPRRVGDTPYRQTSMRVHIHQVTLQHLFTFFHGLAIEDADGPGLRLEAVRLSAPRGEEAGDRWDAEATLTYLVYDPAPVPLGTIMNGPVAGAIPGR